MTDTLPVQLLFRQSAINYADAMILHGRDTYGREHSPLFASALDRFSNTLPDSEAYEEIPGIRQSDRSLRGSSPMHDRSLYRLLYLLSKETNNPLYKREADAAIQFFFDRCQSPATGLMAWGEHIYWDFLNDTIGFESKEYHEASFWPFWDEVYRLHPDAAWRFAIGEWHHQVADSSGDFSRHARWSVHAPERGADFPRYAGQMIERWADAWARPENKDRNDRALLLHAIETMLDRMIQNRERSPSGHLPAFRDAEYAWVDSNLELARCLTAAANQVGGKKNPGLYQKLSAFAGQLDSSILNAPHNIKSGTGFAATLNTTTGLPRDRAMNKSYTSDWEAGYGLTTHAAFATACFERSRQIQKLDPQASDGYKTLALEAADFYLRSDPDTSQILQPEVFADVIQLLMQAWSRSDDDLYLKRAVELAIIGKTIFITPESPLPKATNYHTHYESLTGGGAFMLTLLELSKISAIKKK